MFRYNISFAGAGRVAGALCRELYNCGFSINQVISPSEARGERLAREYGASWSSDLSFSEQNDIIIVAVPDNSLRDVLSEIKCPESATVVHTAGSFGLEIFPPHIKKKGVFYPLQTFSENRKTEFRDLPFFLESSSPETDNILETLAESLGGKSYFISGDRRKMIHLSAVFACNFMNFMLTAGKDISARAGVSFEVLVPLVRETIAKALETGPERSQTGPAVRNDQITIEKHLDLLSFSPELRNIYKDVTEAIINYYRKS